MTTVPEYRPPELLLRIEEVGSRHPELYCKQPLGFAIDTTFEWRPYAATPPDLIQFAWTGGDGVHLGFLTDFGAVTDLARAPIVCVTPQADPQMRIVARNVQELFELLCKVKHARFLEDFGVFHEPEDEWLEAIAAELAEDDDAYGYSRDANAMVELLQKELGLHALAHPHAYADLLAEERQRAISLPTKNGLGVLRTARWDGRSETFAFPEDFTTDFPGMLAFLKTAGHDQKLAFCRDAQSTYSFLPGDSQDVQKLVHETLLELGLPFEADRIKNF
jgi:hypothetical protein